VEIAMPLKWQRGTNPYIHHYFGKLRLGPHATAPQIAVKPKELVKLLNGGQKVELAGLALDEHALKEAANELREPKTLAQELLLVHPQSQRETGKLRGLLTKLGQLNWSEGRFPLNLVHPLALFWFLPAPGSEAAELPPWEAFGFAEPGSPEDAAFDIVFDA
jgi:hypothetical protein